MKKSLLLILVLFACCQHSSAHSEITPKTMIQVGAGICAGVGSLFATSAIVWASHTKTACKIDTSKGNRTDKAIHTLVILSSSCASITSAIASYHAFKTAYNLFRLQTTFVK